MPSPLQHQGVQKGEHQVFLVAMSYYPLLLKLEGQLCLVVGGGAVAERKASSLLEAGARVKVVAPSFTPRLKALGREGMVELAPREYQCQDLNGVALVISASSEREVNARVAREARERGLLVNVVDSPKECTFVVPSVVRRGGLILAISTSGLSPALAHHLREELKKEFGEEFGPLLELLAELRPRAQGRTLEALRQSLGPVLELLRQGKKEEARQTLSLAMGL
jgi:precorrin-2 dehydrogenase/sirohydrochlorin ferrochelatase